MASCRPLVLRTARQAQLLAGDTLDLGGSTLAWSTDVAVLSAGPGVLAQRNGSQGQEWRVYRTYTDDLNGEWGALRWNGLILEIGAAANGLGTLRNVQAVGNRWGFGTSTPQALVHISSAGPNTQFVLETTDNSLNCVFTMQDSSPGQGAALGFNVLDSGSGAVGQFIYLHSVNAFRWLTAGVVRTWLDAAGNYYWDTDGGGDIGKSGSNRPRNVYAAGGVATKVKAGVPTDADFINPVDGMFAVDSTDSKIYVRIGGVWKGVVVT